MAHERVTRKLAAIVAADMVGYSRLMGLDEAGIVARQKACLDELINPKIKEYGGRLVKTTGDGVLVEFPSAVDAVLCSVNIQREMTDREADIEEDRRIQYRVGINLGEIIIEGDDIFGDGVNVAARLEALAEPGGIRISRAVFNNVKGKLDLGFTDLGLQKVKNIAEPIPTYQVLLDPEDVGKLIKANVKPSFSRLGMAAVAVVLVLVVIAGAGIWSWQAGWFVGDAADEMAEINRGPRIAVLPFDRFDNKEDNGFADGLTEDIITRLSYFDNLQVIARNSSFQYRGASVDVREVGRELNSDFVLEGSVRRGAGRVRVTAQLIDAETGDHVWAETYDRELNTSNIFEVQDDIVASIAAAIGGTTGEIARKILSGIKTSRPKFLSGYECVLLSRSIAYSVDIGKYPDSVDCLRNTVKNDPEYSDGCSMTAGMIFLGLTYGADAGERPIPRMYEAAERAISADPKNSSAHFALAQAHFLSKRREEAISSFLHALKLSKYNPEAMSIIAFFLVHLGEFDVAKPTIDRALELTPNPPPTLFIANSYYHYSRKEFDQSLLTLQSIRSDPNNWFKQLHLAVMFVELGRLDEAKAAVAKAKEIEPNVAQILQFTQVLWWWAIPELGNDYRRAFAKAGLELTPPE